LHVVDASTPQALGQAEVVLDELEALGATAPVLTAFNKVDLLAPEERVERLSALWGSLSHCARLGMILATQRMDPPLLFMAGVTGE
jgi:50S ribosomal subunit-associated GTPase HflX